MELQIQLQGKTVFIYINYAMKNNIENHSTIILYFNSLKFLKKFEFVEYFVRYEQNIKKVN